MAVVKFIFFYIGRYSYFLLITCLLLSGFFYKRLEPLYKALVVYLFIMLVCDRFADTIWRFMGNNYLALQLYSFLELAFMLYFYQKHMLRGKNYLLNNIGLAALCYIAAETLWSFVFNSVVIKEYQVYAKVADNFVIILLALTFLYQRMNRFRESKWGNFRLNTVFLLYFTIDTLFFLPFNFMIGQSDIKFYFWALHIIILILLYLYIITEIVINGLKNRPSLSN